MTLSQQGWTFHTGSGHWPTIPGNYRREEGHLFLQRSAHRCLHPRRFVLRLYKSELFFRIPINHSLPDMSSVEIMPGGTEGRRATSSSNGALPLSVPSDTSYSHDSYKSLLFFGKPVTFCYWTWSASKPSQVAQRGGGPPIPPMVPYHCLYPQTLHTLMTFVSHCCSSEDPGLFLTGRVQRIEHAGWR